jgi:hypothetical protein
MSSLVLNPNIQDVIYNGNSCSLYFNGDKIWPNSIIYNVTTSGSHGTVTASPNQGGNGTTVTLSNTPDFGYEFSNYTVTGATLYDGNKFDINGSDVSVVGTFSSAMQQYVNLGSTEYRASGSTIIWQTFTGMPSSSSWNYFTYIFDALLETGTSSGNGAYIFLTNSTQDVIWQMHARKEMSYPGFVGITKQVSAWTTDSQAPAIGSQTIDYISYMYCASKWTKGSYSRFKLVFDRNAKKCYTYIGSTLLGTATLKVDPITISKFGLKPKRTYNSEIAAMKNIKVAGFKYLSDAQNWT